MTAARSEQEATADAGLPRTITHDKGTTEVPVRPQRIVALDNSLVEAVVLLERPLVGGISSYRDLKGFPPYLGDAVADTEEVGPLESPDREAVAALESDVILSATVRHDALYDALYDELSKIAPTVFVKTTGPQWRENITFLGEVRRRGRRRQAAPGVRGPGQDRRRGSQRQDRQPDGVRRALPRRADPPHAEAVVRRPHPGRRRWARPPNQDVDGFAAEAGEEQIRQADGDQVFLTSYSGGQPAKERFQRNPLWAQLAAVKAGDVRGVADEIWMTSVSVQGAHLVLDDLAETFGVADARS